MNWTAILLIVVFLLFYFWAFFRNNNVLRISAVILIALMILFRLAGTESFVKLTVIARTVQGTITEEFKDGAYEVLGYSLDSAMYSAFLLFLIVVLCFRGIEISKKDEITKHKNITQNNEIAKSL